MPAIAIHSYPNWAKLCIMIAYCDAANLNMINTTLLSVQQEKSTDPSPSPLAPGMYLIGRGLVSSPLNNEMPIDRIERFAYYIKALRGVTKENPKGNFSQRELARQTGVNIASIRAYEDREADPNRIDRKHLIRLATTGGITEAEFRSWLNNEPYKSLQPEEILASIRHLNDPAALLDVIEQCAQRLKNIRSMPPEQKYIADPQPEPLPEINQFILDKLTERQNYLGLDDEKFKDYCQLLSVSPDDIESLEHGNEIDLVLLGNFARILGTTVDELVELRSRSEEPNEDEELEDSDEESENNSDDDDEPKALNGISPKPKDQNSGNNGNKFSSRNRRRRK